MTTPFVNGECHIIKLTGSDSASEVERFLYKLFVYLHHKYEIEPSIDYGYVVEKRTENWALFVTLMIMGSRELVQRQISQGELHSLGPIHLIELPRVQAYVEQMAFDAEWGVLP